MKFLKSKKEAKLRHIPSISKEQILPYFGIIILIGVFYLVARIFRPYLWLGFWAMLFYISFYAFNRRLKVVLHIMERRRKNKPKIKLSSKDISAALSTLLTLILIIVPGTILTRYLVIEAYYAIGNLHIFLSDQSLFDSMSNLPIIPSLISRQPFFWVELFNIFEDFIKNYGSYLDSNRIGSWIGNLFVFLRGSIRFTLSLAINLFLVMTLLYFLFRDGTAFYRSLRVNLPLPPQITDHFTGQVYQTVLDILKGTVFVSLLQGGAVASALLLCGFQNAIILGLIAAIFSVIPVVGTASIWLPSSLYLAFAESRYAAAMGLAIFCLGAYLVLENIVKPKLFVARLGIHPLFIFFAILGGLVEFGFVGFLLGPLFLVLLKIVWNIYHVWGPKSS